MRIYKINNKTGYLDGIKIVPDGTKGIDPYFTRTAPPDLIPEGMYAMWKGNGWSLTSKPPYLPDPIIPTDSQDSDFSELIDSSSSIDSNQ